MHYSHVIKLKSQAFENHEVEKKHGCPAHYCDVN